MANPAKAGDAKLRGYSARKCAMPVEPPNHYFAEDVGYAFHHGTDRCRPGRRSVFR
jgi:hypothetical protein